MVNETNARSFRWKQVHLPLICLFLLSYTASIAQNGLSLYHMRYVPQANALNPALTPLTDFYISVPGAGSLEVLASNSSFSLKDLEWSLSDLRSGNAPDNLSQRLAATARPSNHLHTLARAELLSFGWRQGRHYIGFSVSEVGEVMANAPKALFDFLYDYEQYFENGSDSYDLRDLYAQAVYYRPYTFTYAVDVEPRWTLGWQASYLTGIASLTARESSLRVEQPASTPTGFDLKGTVDVQYAGLFAIDSTDHTLSDYLLQPGNHGFSVGFGTRFSTLDDHLEFSLAATQLGMIYWSENPREIAPDNNAIESADDLNAIADAFWTPRLHPSHAYRQMLVPSLLFSSTYFFQDETAIGLVFQSRPMNQRLNPTVGLNVSTRLKKWLGVSTGYNYSADAHHIGLGLSINPGPIQLYLVSDNISSLFFPESAYKLHAHAGLNITIGKFRRGMPPAEGPIAAVPEAIPPLPVVEVETSDSAIAVVPEPTELGLEKAPTHFILTEAGYIYKEPSLRASILKILPGNTPFELESKYSEAWWYVEIEGQEGWLHIEGNVKVAAPKPVAATPVPAPDFSKKAPLTQQKGEASDPFYQPTDLSDPAILHYITSNAKLLFDGPSEDAPILSGVSPGAEIEVLKKFSEEWWHVKIDKRQGWIQPDLHLLPKEIPGKPEPPIHKKAPTYETAALKPVEPKNGQPFTLSERTEVWATPTIGIDQLVILPAGLTVQVLEKANNDWWKIAYKEYEGYVRLKVAPSNVPKAATTSDNSPSIGTYTMTDATSLREDATHKSGVILRLQSGDKVELLEKTDQWWWKIRFAGKVGWAKAAKMK